ncbi:MAG: hypothetical protein IJ778_01110, partial [Alphaproteobacteria bacterium]|nr:hypothetical protein [Alphaproteobacteria bacterium]
NFNYFIMNGYVSVYDIRSAVSEMSNRQAMIVLSRMTNNQVLQAKWSSDFGLDSLEQLELAQILEKKCHVKLIEKAFAVSSDKVGDFLRAVNFEESGKEITLSKVRAAFDVLGDEALARRAYQMPDEVLLGADIHKDIGMASLDVIELIMHLEKQNGIEIPFDVEEKMSGNCTVAKLIELCNSYAR